MEFKSATARGRLDNILKFLHYEHYGDLIPVSVISGAIGEMSEEEEYSYSLCRLMIEFLVNEQYIQEQDNLDFYYISHFGSMFIEEGGYQERYNSLMRKQAWEIEMQEASRKNAERLNELTYWLTIGTGLAAIAGFGLLALEVYNKYCPCP